MTLPKIIFEKFSIAEYLTVLFIVSVGFSMLYKYGFYGTLGIEWYLYTLSPQQLFVTTVSLVIASFAGLLTGILLGVKLKERQAFFVFLLMFIAIWLNPLGFLLKLNITYLLPDWFYLFSLNFMSVLVPTSMELLTIKKNSIIVTNDSPPKLDKFDQILRYSLPLIVIFGFTLMPYFSGVDAANRILKDGGNLNFVKLKGESNEWLLVEMNGDKVLLKENCEKAVFKIIEYKEIETITVK